MSDYFLTIVGGESVSKKKPSGEGILKVGRELGVEPCEIGYVGDTTTDVSAARDAKVTSIVVCSGMGNRLQLSLARPDHLYRDILDMSGFI